jgi:hypothetical protein
MAPTKTLLVPSLLVSVSYSIPNFCISQHKIFINVVFPYPTRYYIRICIRASLLRWGKKTFEGESKRPEGEGGVGGRGGSQKSQFHRCCRVITTAKLVLKLEIVCCMRI